MLRKTIMQGLIATVVGTVATTVAADPAVNKAIDPATWKRGPLYSPPAGGTPDWNPAKIRMNAGLLTNGGTIGSVPVGNRVLQRRQSDRRGLERLHLDRGPA